MLFILMNKHTPILKLDIDDGYILSIDGIYDTRYLPVGVSAKPDRMKATLREWWKNRQIPASRDNISEGLSKLGIHADQLPPFVLEKCFGLSLSDQYWINPADSPLQWAEVNFFENTFSEDIGKALFHNLPVNNPDLMSPDNTSDGCLKKKWKILDGKRCLIKAGSRPYFQQSFNEAIASCICRRLGISHVEYRLDFENEELVSICRNFITADTELVPAISLMESRKNQTIFPIMTFTRRYAGKKVLRISVTASMR